MTKPMTLPQLIELIKDFLQHNVAAGDSIKIHGKIMPFDSTGLNKTIEFSIEEYIGEE